MWFIMKNIAIILSGGSGSRFGGALPKQFTKLAGRAIIEYTIEAFEQHNLIDEILVVSQPAHIERTLELIKQNKWKKVSKVVTGGKERFDSTYSALKALQDYPVECKVLFHDAVRPLVTHKIIQDSIEALEYFQAIDVVIPSADTLVEIYDNGCIANIPSRSTMRRGQTPQGFHLGLIQEAYKQAIEKNQFSFTCDCGVVRAMLPQTRVATIDGDEKNIKVTYPMDLFIAEKYLQASNENALNLVDNLSFLKGKNVVIFGGSSGIGLEIKNLAVLNQANVIVASRRCNDTDVCQLASVKDFLEKTECDYGCIDYVINTAGILIKKPIDALSQDEIAQLIGINFTGAVNVAIASKPYLAKSKGMLVNFTSSSYTRGRAFYALYSSSNAGVVNLTQALADEWVGEVRVNCINPERTATPMRTSNFGIEPGGLLLDAKDVAIITLRLLNMQKTGIVVDVRKDGR